LECLAVVALRRATASPRRVHPIVFLAAIRNMLSFTGQPSPDKEGSESVASVSHCLYAAGCALFAFVTTVLMEKHKGCDDVKKQSQEKTTAMGSHPCIQHLVFHDPHYGGSGNGAENAAAGGASRREEPETATGQACGKGSAGWKTGHKPSAQAKPASVSHRQGAAASHRAS